jgi:hypothetical protein
MKNAFRKLAALVAFGPFIVAIHVTSLVVGKRKAVRLWGPIVTFTTRLSLYLFVPRIEDASQFDDFRRFFRSRLNWAWKPFFDARVEQDDEDTFRLHVANCPFCEVFIGAGLGEMGPYVCQADWDMARRNIERWEFERVHQIGTGDAFCDSTYRRKEGGGNDGGA